MSVHAQDDSEPEGIKPSDAVVAVGTILPANAYAEPVYTDVILPPATWTRLAGRDITRGAFIVLRADVDAPFTVQPGTNRMACPFVINNHDMSFTLRYVDFLTIVTGDFFGFSTAGETVTVATIRLN